mgnify:FL=1|jgi:hypothetical protein
MTKTRWSSTGKLKIRTYTAPDGTPVSIKDMDLLLELNKNPTRWLRDYKKTERSNDMTKKKAKKTKKKVSALDKIQKSLNKLEALHEKQSDMIFDINELIDDAQMDEDDSYHLD